MRSDRPRALLLFIAALTGLTGLHTASANIRPGDPKRANDPAHDSLRAFRAEKRRIREELRLREEQQQALQKPNKALIREPVRGLYSSIPGSPEALGPAGTSFAYKSGDWSIVTRKSGPGYTSDIELDTREKSGSPIRIQEQTWASFLIEFLRLHYDRLKPNPEIQETAEIALEREALEILINGFKENSTLSRGQRFRSSTHFIKLLDDLCLDPVRVLKLKETQKNLEPYLMKLTKGLMRLPENHPELFESNPYLFPLTGRMSRSINEFDHSLTFEGAGLQTNLKGENVMGFINTPESIPLIKGRGIPTQVFVTLMQMKLAGVEYGTLKTARTNHIGNSLTHFELAVSPAIRTWTQKNPGKEIPDEIVAQEILNTNTGRYIETVLIQSGHRIKKITVSETITKIIDDDHRRTQNQREKEVLKTLTNGRPYPAYFKLEFELEPWDSGSATPANYN